MTFCIIARDEATGRIGAAVASKFLAVGARNLFVRNGAGVVVSNRRPATLRRKRPRAKRAKLRPCRCTS